LLKLYAIMYLESKGREITMNIQLLIKKCETLISEIRKEADSESEMVDFVNLELLGNKVFMFKLALIEKDLK